MCPRPHAKIWRKILHGVISYLVDKNDFLFHSTMNESTDMNDVGINFENEK